MRKKIVRVGEVISNRMDKSVVLKVTTVRRHPLYRKTVKRATKLYVHDPKNECQIGDSVKVVQTRPISKMKRWRVIEILNRGEDK
ncbi:TPA: 30S ribosomal protein S17 [bacterium]|nr:30S ribosomal protein S17 [bacterium]